MRKGYRSADARLMFFEKEKVYCKLTVASAIQKGLLHVSFGAVRSRCRCALKKAFLYRLALHELKKFAFSTNQKVFFCKNLSLFPSKATLFCPPLPISTPLNLLSAKNSHFHKSKVFLLHKSFLNCYPKHPFSTLRRPFVPPLTYCPQRMQLFFCCSL